MSEKSWPEGWTREDISHLLEQLDKGPILVADTALGIPTIHGIRPEPAHLGYGLFEVKAPEYTVRFDGGGGMLRTPGGKSWTRLVTVQGTYPYDVEAVRQVLLDWLAEPEAKPQPPAALTGARVRRPLPDKLLGNLRDLHSLALRPNLAYEDDVFVIGPHGLEWGAYYKQGNQVVPLYPWQGSDQVIAGETPERCREALCEHLLANGSTVHVMFGDNQPAVRSTPHTVFELPPVPRGTVSILWDQDGAVLWTADAEAYRDYGELHVAFDALQAVKGWLEARGCTVWGVGKGFGSKELHARVQGEGQGEFEHYEGQAGEPPQLVTLTVQPSTWAKALKDLLRQAGSESPSVEAHDLGLCVSGHVKALANRVYDQAAAGGHNWTPVVHKRLTQAAEADPILGRAGDAYYPIEWWLRFLPDKPLVSGVDMDRVMAERVWTALETLPGDSQCVCCYSYYHANAALTHGKPEVWYQEEGCPGIVICPACYVQVQRLQKAKGKKSGAAAGKSKRAPATGSVSPARARPKLPEGVTEVIEIKQGRLGWVCAIAVGSDAHALHYRIGEGGAVRKTPLAGRDITWRAIAG